MWEGGRVPVATGDWVPDGMGRRGVFGRFVLCTEVFFEGHEGPRRGAVSDRVAVWANDGFLIRSVEPRLFAFDLTG